MGCGCITPGSSIRTHNGQYIHSIKVTRLQKGTQRKFGQIHFPLHRSLQKQSSKNEFYASKATINFHSKFGTHKNTDGQIKNLRKKPIISIEDLKQANNKKKKNVKFKDEPRLSIKLQPIETAGSDSKIPFNSFDKQNISSKKILKKPKNLRVRTQKSEVIPFIDYSFYTMADNKFLNSNESIAYEVRKNQSSHKLPKIQRFHTQSQSNEYLESLKQIVLFGQTKKQILSKEELRIEEKTLKNPLQHPGFDVPTDRLDFKKKTQRFS